MPEVEGYIVGAMLVVIVAGFRSGADGNKLTKVLHSPRRIARYAVQTIAPMDGTYSYIEACSDGAVNVRTNSAGSVYGTIAVPLQ